MINCHTNHNVCTHCTVHRHSAGIKIQAAVATKPHTPLSLMSLEMDGPRSDEVLVKLVASGALAYAVLRVYIVCYCLRYPV